MAYDAQGNYVSDLQSTGLNLGSMSQWGNSSSLSQGLGGVQQGTGFGQSGFNANQIAPIAGQGDNSLFSRSSLFGGTDALGNQTSGWAAPAIGAASGLAQSWLGFQNLGMAKDQLSFQKSAWQDQFNIQKEEYEYQKKRREDRVANYEASLDRNSAATPSNL